MIASDSNDPVQADAAVSDSIGSILERYLASLEAGCPLPVETLLRQHPVHAPALTAAIRQLDELHRVSLGVEKCTPSGEAAIGTVNGDGGTLGDFRILRQIGRGGMGIVYLAEQISLNRRVALKALPFAALLDERRLARFQNEAQAAAHLHHPNIVPVYAIGSERDVHYYAMQYIDGQSLADVISELRRIREVDVNTGPGDRTNATDSDDTPHDGNTHPISLAAEFTMEMTGLMPSSEHPLRTKRHAKQEYFRATARLMIQAAHALEYAHSQGVLHRDVKPANLMLDRQGQLWITDFGLARFRDDLTATVSGEVVGTLRYMAPEQARGSRLLDERVDVYSLGATLYELLTCVPAFPHSDAKELLHAVLNNEPPRPRQIERQLLSELETIVLKAMAKERGDRYGSAAELAADLECFVEGRPIRAKRASIAKRVARWSSRNPAMAGMFLLIAFAVMVIGLGAVWYQGQLRVAAARVDSAETAKNAERYFTLRTRALRLATDRPSEWTVSAMTSLSEAARLPAAAQDRESLRSEAVSVLCSTDLVQVATLKHSTTVFCLAYSPDGKRLAVASNLNEDQVPIEIWDPVAGKIIDTLHFPADPNYVTTSGRRADGARGIAFSRNGRYLTVGSRSGWIHVWDHATNPPTRTSWQAHSSEVNHLVFGKHNDQVLSAGNDGWLHLWSLASCEQLRSHHFEGPVEDLAVGLNWRRLTCAFADRVESLEFANFEDRQVNSANNDARRRVALGPATFSVTTTSGKLQVLDYMGNLAMSLPIDRDGPAHEGVIEHLAISPDGGLIASTCSQELKLWDTMTGKLLWRRGYKNGARICVEFSPHGDQLAVTADQETHIYRINGYSTRYRQAQGVSPICAFDIHHRYDAILTLGLDHVAAETMTARLWSHSRYECGSIRSEGTTTWGMDNVVCLAGPTRFFVVSENENLGPNCLDYHSYSKIIHTFPVRDICDLVYDANAKELWAACAWPLSQGSRATGGIRAWHIETGAETAQWVNSEAIAAFEVTEIHCLDVGPNIVVAGAHDESVKVFQRRPLALLHNIASPGGRMRTIAMTRNEDLVFAGTDKGKLLVIRPADGQLMAQIDAHAESIESLALNPDESILATGANDGTLRIWRLLDGQLIPLYSLPRQHGGMIRIEFAPKRNYLITLARGDTALQVWHLELLGKELDRMGMAW